MKRVFGKHQQQTFKSPQRTTGVLRPGSVAWAVLAVMLVLPMVAEAQMTKEEEEYLREKKFGPTTTYIITPRIRGIWIADWELDLFLDRHASHWSGQTNMEYGLEFAVRKPDNYQLVFSAAWADISMPDAWWLEADDPPRKADWTSFDYGMVVVDGSFYKEWAISRVFQIYAGGGLGLGVFVGESKKRDPSLECVGAVTLTNNADDLDKAPCFENGEPSLDPLDSAEDTGIPPVLPWINVTVGSQFVIADYGIVRIDTGFKGYWFAGLSLGAQWW